MMEYRLGGVTMVKLILTDQLVVGGNRKSVGLGALVGTLIAHIDKQDALLAMQQTIALRYIVDVSPRQRAAA